MNQQTALFSSEFRAAVNSTTAQQNHTPLRADTERSQHPNRKPAHLPTDTKEAHTTTSRHLAALRGPASPPTNEQPRQSPSYALTATTSTTSQRSSPHHPTGQRTTRNAPQSEPQNDARQTHQPASHQPPHRATSTTTPASNLTPNTQHTVFYEQRNTQQQHSVNTRASYGFASLRPDRPAQQNHTPLRADTQGPRLTTSN